MQEKFDPNRASRKDTRNTRVERCEGLRSDRAGESASDASGQLGGGRPRLGRARREKMYYDAKTLSGQHDSIVELYPINPVNTPALNPTYKNFEGSRPLFL
jgi:hypothetical protein